MDKLSRILLIVILILTIGLISMICLYYDIREKAYENLNAKEKTEIIIQTSKGNLNEKATIEYVKTIDDKEERKEFINTYVKFRMLTQDVADELY